MADISYYGRLTLEKDAKPFELLIGDTVDLNDSPHKVVGKTADGLEIWIAPSNARFLTPQQSAPSALPHV